MRSVRSSSRRAGRGQAPRDRARPGLAGDQGDDPGTRRAGRCRTAIRPGHPFGYLASEELFDDGTQLLIGFGPDAERYDGDGVTGVQRQLDEILPGYEALEATAHDWLADEFSRGTWAIHRPGWYEHHHAAMQRREGSVLFAGSDLADGWAGFIDGAIESGLRAGRAAAALSG